MPEFDLTEPQSDLFVSGSKYTAVVAGFGSGKTDGAIHRLLTRKFEYPNVNMAYLAPTYPLIRDIFYPKMEELLSDLGEKFHINQGAHKISIQGYGDIICRTMEKPEHIIGWEVGDAFLDEYDVLPIDKAYKVMRKITARCRKEFPDGKKNQIYITTTPEGFKATYQQFVKTPLEDSCLIQMATSSNAHNLPDDYIPTLMSQYPANLIEAYLNGKFVNLTSGSVYEQYNRNRNRTHYVAKPREALHIGMDFNVGKMSAIVHIIRRDEILKREIPHAVAEVMGVRDTPAIIEAIEQLYSDHPITIYPDSSGGSSRTTNASKSDIKLLTDAGFKVDAPKANPLVRNRILAMNTMFYNKNREVQYRVNSDTCPVYVETLEQQAYDNQGMPDKQHDQDHPPDAAGYFIHRKYGLDKLVTRKTRVRGL